ncbi:LysE family translocator [Marinoscillum pacificum]|uniref:LysE family translocator n=1 Tax=Marinoscillum pacificum TaxID=392723 RepID=UPI002157A21F|nr:LysE family translocator [Marinoscillum pacificum]
MLDYSTAHWITFFTAAILLNLSPGPDMVFIISQTSKKGTRSGFTAVLGIWLGTFVHVIFAALGLSAILMTSATAFSMVKWVGAAYLVWLGIQSLSSKGTRLQSNDQAPTLNLTKTFRQGIFVSLLNPKVAVFFLAFLPQFVEPQAGVVGTQLFLHGSLIIVVAGFIEIPIVLMSSQLTNYLRNHPKVSQWMDRGLGALFIALGVKLAACNR